MATSASRDRRARLRIRTLVRGWPWYYETTPVFRHEVVLHSIPNVRGYFQEDMGAWAVAPGGFKPRPKHDVDGMSFFRDDFTSQRDLAKASRHPDGVRVSRFTVRQLRELGLDPEADPDHNELPGHVIVRALCFVDKNLLTDADRQKMRDVQQRLAQLATANGVYCPPNLPDPTRR